MARAVLDHSPSRQQPWHLICPSHQTPSHLPEEPSVWVQSCCPLAWEELPVNTSPVPSLSCAHTAHKSPIMCLGWCSLQCPHRCPITVSSRLPLCLLGPSCCLSPYPLVRSCQAQELCVLALYLHNTQYCGVLIHDRSCRCYHNSNKDLMR